MVSRGNASKCLVDRDQWISAVFRDNAYRQTWGVVTLGLLKHTLEFVTSTEKSYRTTLFIVDF